MGRSEQFAQALAEEQKKAAEKKANGGYEKRDYEKIPYVGLEVGVPTVVRIIGEPLSVRTLSTSPKVIMTSLVNDDKGDLFTIKWSDDKKWILWDIFNKVMAYDWDKDMINPATNKKGMRIYKNATKHTAIFNRMRWNNKLDNEKERGFNPAISVVANVIDQADYAWHKANKSFKLIAKKIKVDDTDATKLYPQPGIPKTCFDLIMKTSVEEKGFWEDFDIAIVKNDKDPYYDVYSYFDQRKIEDKLAKYNRVMSNTPLTEEEQNWKMFDLDHLFQVTSYTKLLNRLGEFVKEIDVAFKTNYYDRLVQLSTDEKAMWEANKKKEEDGDETVTETPVARAPRTQSTDFWTQAKNAGWKKVDELKSEFGQYVKNIEISTDGKSDHITYVDDEGKTIPVSEILPCGACGIETIELLDTCPKCGCKF